MCLGQAFRYVHCPTCRQKAPVADIAFVDAGRTAAKEAGASSSKQHEEETLYVRGSYSTKVRIALLSSAQMSPRRASVAIQQNGILR